jgi:hypothetical protein
MSLQERIERHFNPTRFSTLEHVELEKAEMCPANEQDPEPYPCGFFRAETLSGLAADGGFYCPKCHVLHQVGLLEGQTVKHCGKTERVPAITDRLPLRRVGEFFNSPKQQASAYLVPVGF